MFEWAYGNGWVGVVLGLVCFGMGFWKGRYDRSYLQHIAEAVIDDLVRQRFIRTRRIYNDETGEWEVDLLEYDHKD
jgi:hypothetical protein